MQEKHPGASAYNRGCRCPECTEIHRLRHAATRAALTIKGAEHPELIPHGTCGGYSNWGCHCELCSAANTAHSAAWRRHHGRPGQAREKDEK